jgi:hypothetical protein
MASNKKKEKSISVADILMTIGFVLLTYSTFLGVQLLQGDYTTSFLITGGIIIGTALLLWVIYTAKGKNNYRQAWLKTEIVGIVLFTGLFIWGTGYGRHYLYIVSIKEDLYKVAQKDIAKIDKLFQDYEKTEENDINDIRGNIKGLPRNIKYQVEKNDTTTTNALGKWAGDDKITVGGVYNQSQLDSIAKKFESLLKDILLGDKYNDYKNSKKESLQKILQDIKSGRGHSSYYQSANYINDKYPEIAKQLTEYSSHEMKFTIKSVNNTAIVKVYRKPETYQANSKMEFIKMFDGKKKSTPTGWLLTFIIWLLILCEYFAAPRSRRVTALTGNGKFEQNDDGIEIPIIK